MPRLKNHASKNKEVVVQNDHEMSFYIELSKIEKILREIRLIDICECLMCEMKNDDLKKYQILMTDLSNSLSELFKYEILLINFKNNQMTNDLILRSFKELIQSNEKFNFRNKSFSLLNYLLDETSKKSSFYGEPGKTKWYNELMQEFFFSIQKQINDLISSDSFPKYDFYFQNEIVDLINNLFKFSKFNDLSFQVISSFMNFLKLKSDKKNIEKIIQTSQMILNNICQEILIGEASSVMLRIKIYSILGFFKDFIIFLLKNYEHEVITSKGDVIEEFLDCLKLMKTYHCTDIGGVCYEVYDRFLILLNNKIDHVNSLDIDTVKFCVKLAERFVDDSFKNSKLLSPRHESLLEIMIKIITNSKLNLDKEANFKILKMAYFSINSILSNKMNGITFLYIYEKYWNSMKEPWLNTIRHEKGDIGLQLIGCFLSDFDSNDFTQTEILSFFFDAFQEYFDLNKKWNPENIFYGTEDILINVLYRFKKFKNCPHLTNKFNQIILAFFEFGKRLDFSQWNTNFSTFNFELMSNEFDAIFKQEHLLESFFELTIGKLKLAELKKMELSKPNIRWDCISSGNYYFISQFIKKLKTRLNDETKFELIAFLDYLGNKNESNDDKKFCQRNIKALLEL